MKSDFVSSPLSNPLFHNSKKTNASQRSKLKDEWLRLMLRRSCRFVESADDEDDDDDVI